MSPDVVFGYAPGKVILFGEHAVVYGQPAIAATIDRGIRVAVSQGAHDDGPIMRSNGAGLPMRAKPDPHGDGPQALREALATVVQLQGVRAKRLSFTVDAEIPAGAGLGSSAALAIALLRGTAQYFGEPALDFDTLVKRAFVIERVFHGNPSGVDHATIAHGGCVVYQRDVGADTFAVSALVLKRRLRLAVGIAGPHAGTKSAVAALRDRATRHPAHYQRIYDSIGDIARAARGHLADGALGAVGELMDLNHGLLNALGVSTPAIEALVSIARDRGALGAKLSGAGGGGAVIALVDDDPAPVVSAFEAAGFAAFATQIDQPASQETA